MVTELDLKYLVDGIAKLGLSRTELTRVKAALQDPSLAKQLSVAFEDPIVANKLIDSFEVPVFRTTFFEDPIVAVRSVIGGTRR